MDVQQQFMKEQNLVEPTILYCNSCQLIPKQPVVTSCGHIFCWNCIRKSIKDQQYCPICKQAIIIDKSYPIFVDDRKHEVGEQNLQEGQQSTLQIKRPKPIYNDKIPNPGMGAAGAQIGVSNLPNNITRNKKVAGFGYSAASFIQTFNNIQEPEQNDPDKKVSTFCNKISKMLYIFFGLIILLSVLQII